MIKSGHRGKRFLGTKTTQLGNVLVDGFAASRPLKITYQALYFQINYSFILI